MRMRIFFTIIIERIEQRRREKKLNEKIEEEMNGRKAEDEKF